MSQVRVRDKHQITLPAAVVRAANIQPDDVLEVTYRAGVITLTSKQAQAPQPSLMALAGSTKGLYGRSTQERLAYLDHERAAWE